MAVRVFGSLAEYMDAAGEEIGASEWHEISQEQINAFANATGDHQWIHVDPDRAAAGPFGHTIAHGFLTLSMLPVLGGETYHIEGLAMAVNYGLDRVRFPAPVPVGARIRATTVLRETKQTSLGVLSYCRVTVHAEGHEKAVCVADTVTLYVAA